MNGVEIREELVLLNEDFKSSDEILDRLGRHLFGLGYVKESFIQAVKDREQIFATGLPTEGYGIAIPHADIEHVNKPCICVATLKNAVDFRMMSDCDQIIHVYIIIMLALKEGHQHMKLLSKLMGSLQDPKILEYIYKSDSSEEVSKLLNSIIQD